MDTTPRQANRFFRPVAALAIVAILIAACGGATVPTQTVKPIGTPASGGAREIAIAMQDISFDTTAIDVTAGETIQFVFTNTGAIRHEAIIGDMARQEEHKMEMTEMTGSAAPDESQMAMAEPWELRLDPGATGTLDFTFDHAGTFYIGCHEPGHYAAGMVATVNVN